MRIEQPVFAKPLEVDGVQKLKIWGRDGPIIVSPPILPYKFYEPSDLPEGVKHTSVLKKLLSSQKVKKLAKVEFDTLSEVDEFEYRNEIVGIQPTRDYINLINQHEPEFFNQFGGTELNILYLDIEQFVRKGDPFPTPDKPVISISYAFNDEKIQHYSMIEYSERDLIHKFATDLVKRDPDIIVGFNHCKYDIPVLEHKFKEFNIPDKAWSREMARAPFYYEKSVGPATLQCVSLEGRLVFDVFHATLTDQTLSGQPRGLKPVSQYYQKSINKSNKEESYRIDEIITEDLGGNGTEYLLKEPEKLRRYNNSDVQLTRALFNFYFSNTKAIAAFNGVPLNKLVPLASTYAFTQVLGNTLIENNVLADGNNAKKYPYAFDTLGVYIDPRTNKKKAQKPYQGALSDCYHPGLYFDHIEDDVGSLYPSLMAALGAGPDNTRIVDTIKFSDYREEIKKGETFIHGETPAQEFKVTRKGDVRTYYLPDSTRKWTWVIEVKGVSPVALKIKEFLKTRMELKSRAKKEKSETLFARAYALKVSLNSCYGIAGSKVLPFGELGVAALTTLTGRLVLLEGMEFMGRDNITLVDTDSIKYGSEHERPIEELNAHFATWTENVLLGEPLIVWERERFPAILLVQPKTYLKLKLDKDTSEYYMEKTGGSFKGTRYTNIFNNVIDTVGFTLLSEGEDAARGVAKEFFDLTRYTEEDFTMTLKLGKMPDQYESAGAQAPQLAKLYEDKLGIKPYVGMNMRFVNTEQGFDIVTEESLKNLDNRYYIQIVSDAMERLNLTNVLSKDEFEVLVRPRAQTGLEQWM